MWVGGSMVINDEMTLGEIIAFVAYLSLLIWPVIAFGWVINIIQQASASMKRLLKIFAEVDDVRDSAITNNNIENLSGDIEFKNVSFKYAPGSPEVLGTPGRYSACSGAPG